MDKKAMVFVTGHSMGAAHATICAMDLRGEDYKDVILYNYGSPAVFGDKHDAKKFKALVPDSFRIMQPEDPIPKIGEIGANHIDFGLVIPKKYQSGSGFGTHPMQGYVDGLEATQDAGANPILFPSAYAMSHNADSFFAASRRPV